MNEVSHTPMMRQYLALKERDPEALLLFRMGDFYEMFAADAERAANLLGLTLTSREKGENAVAMAGFPHFALEGYLAKLVQLGVRAAVCEQVEDPREAKGLVKREIVRIVTPGTLTDDNLLDPKTSNYLAAVVEVRGKLGLAWVELSTGFFSLTGVMRRELLDELARIAPAELIVSETSLGEPWLQPIRDSFAKIAITVRPSWDFLPDQARNALHDHFRVKTLSGFGVDDESIETLAAGALLAYLRETQLASLGHLVRLTPFQRKSILGLDETTRRSLELTKTIREGKREGSLLAVIDRACSPMGSRLLAEQLTSPLTGLDAIEARLDAVAELVRESELRRDLRETLDRVSDLERLASRVGTGRASPRDLVALARTLALLPAIKAKIENRSASLLRDLNQSLELCPEVRESIEATLVDDPPLQLKEGGLIRDGFHADLDELRDTARGGKSWIAKFQAEQIRRTGINNLKVGFNKVFGYFIEVSHAQGSRVPADFIRKQTVKNAERYITPELKEHEDRVLRAEDRAKELEFELFTTLRDRVAAEAPRLVQAGSVLARVDALAALAELAVALDYVRPELTADPILEIDQGRHPVLDSIMPAGGFVPNDLNLDPEHGNILLITGPNMAGKSTYIRQTALIVVLAQMGSFVPARRARVGVADRLFARVGASDELARGQSTFMVEMTETANILNNATDRSLVILDEIGRGTSTFDGISLAWAITEHIHDVIRCRTLFATHYHELVDLEKTKSRLRNANVAVGEQDGSIVFLHRIVPGGADQSYGIHVAQLAGVPAPLLDRARSILAFLEKQHLADSGKKPDEAIDTSSNENKSTDTSVRESEAAGDQNAPAARSESPPRIPRVKTGKALHNSLFAALPDPLLIELREIDPNRIGGDEAIELIKRLRELAR